MSDDLMDLRAVCEFFGGKDSPLDPSTIYRGIKNGRFPKPFNVTPQNTRWLRRECEAARQKLIEAAGK